MRQADLIVIGAGAAGTLAALIAGRAGVKVLLIEKNRTIGRKLAITGGGRCNLTNQTDLSELIINIPGNGRFLYSALQRFGPAEVMDLFQTVLGVPLKVERGRRVFPASDQAQEVVQALGQALQKAQVELLTETKVTALNCNSESKVTGVTCNGDRQYQAEAVILATGGASYPGTGSTGDGYRLAKSVGHTIIPIRPALVPLITKEAWVEKLEGLSLTNVLVTSIYRDKKQQSEFGELLFTGNGLSGPVILSLSREIVPLVTIEPGSVIISIDLKPALTEEELDSRIQRDFAKMINKFFKNALDELLPQKLIPVMIELSEIDPTKPVHQITREERWRLVHLFKKFELTVIKPGLLAEAIVTVGGISTKELNPKTMESKIISGLYCVGEVVDVDGYTGGYNLQIAFAMGYVAATAVAQRLRVNYS